MISFSEKCLSPRIEFNSFAFGKMDQCEKNVYHYGPILVSVYLEIVDLVGVERFRNGYIDIFETPA